MIHLIFIFKGETTFWEQDIHFGFILKGGNFILRTRLNKYVHCYQKHYLSTYSNPSTKFTENGILNDLRTLKIWNWLTNFAFIPDLS